MKRLLKNKDLLIKETIEFVIKNSKRYNMHIVSGSDQDELRFLCSQHKIDHNFKSIHGSPTPKMKLVADLLESNNYKPAECILIGDSFNDFESAQVNNIGFMAYNNPAIVKYSTDSISLKNE